MRALWLGLGLLAVALGGLGLVLPVLPTTPFMLLAAACFAKSSPRLHGWLVRHPVFGPSLRNWAERGAISVGAKRAAALAMAAVFAVSLVLRLPLWALAVQGVAMGGALTFILTQPS
ncbi:YbaN family protein [Paracoccaceae bacterium]